MIQVPQWQSRTNLLLGEEKITALANAHVLVMGLGGVGAIAAEMICRAGVGTMTIVDGDKVEASNRNRQLGALISTDNQLKAEVVAARLKDINAELKLHIVAQYLQNEAIDSLLDTRYDYVIDAIDTLAPKLHLISQCIHRNIPLISSMGAGGKMDITQVQVADISQSYQCRLARYVRKRLAKQHIKSGFQVVFSPEQVDRERVKEISNGINKKSVIGTISYMPAIFGCTCASVVIRDLINSKK